MGRKAKIISKALLDPEIGTAMICPVCGKEFTASDETKYIARGGFTCSWSCFLNAVNETKTNTADKKRRTVKADTIKTVPESTPIEVPKVPEITKVETDDMGLFDILD